MADPAALTEMLREFHIAISQPATDLLWMRRTLHDEEHAELVDAIEEGNLENIARELADVVYVAFGTALAYGIDLDAALREVHRANMQKATGPRRDDGKVMKPDGFIEPDMIEAVRHATGLLCCVCGDAKPVPTVAPNPDAPQGLCHPECVERYWDPPGEQALTGESW